ncbi:uncharacterized protein RJT20DRAFT_132194 [Scheffersomyces xylosifermentans]|uniref:uncharacterized protein n=1 Tax=Scheffersomyces xylosifermentans TaxID=1304137 RepID=UPI00315C5FE2
MSTAGLSHMELRPLDFKEKENDVLRTPTKITKRKSYSILSPISNVQSASPYDNSLSKKLSNLKNERVISESTGLVKLALAGNNKSGVSNKSRSSLSSPHSNTSFASTNTTNSTPARSGLPVYIPIEQKEDVHPMEKKEDYREVHQRLLEKYAEKQRELIEHEKKVDLCKFELLEISTKLEACKREEMVDQLRKQRHPSGEHDLFKKIHSQTDREIRELQIEQPQSISALEEKISIDALKKKASNIFNIAESSSSEVGDKELNLSNLRKKASMFYTNIPNTFEELSGMSKRANTVFANSATKSSSDLQSLINTSNEKFDDLSSRTNKFFSGVVNNLSPKKNDKLVSNNSNTKLYSTINSLSKNFNLTFNKGMSHLDEDEDKELIYNSSFNFDNFPLDTPFSAVNESSFTGGSEHGDGEVTNLDVIYENDDESSMLHIDDYNSTLEED